MERLWKEEVDSQQEDGFSTAQYTPKGIGIGHGVQGLCFAGWECMSGVETSLLSTSQWRKMMGKVYVLNTQRTMGNACDCM